MPIYPPELVPHLMCVLKHVFAKREPRDGSVSLRVEELPPKCVTTLRKHSGVYRVQHQKGEVFFRVFDNEEVAIKVVGSQEAIEQLHDYFAYHISPRLEHLRDDRDSNSFESHVRVLALSLLAHPDTR